MNLKKKLNLLNEMWTKKKGKKIKELQGLLFIYFCNSDVILQ